MPLLILSLSLIEPLASVVAGHVCCILQLIRRSSSFAKSRSGVACCDSRENTTPNLSCLRLSGGAYFHWQEYRASRVDLVNGWSWEVGCMLKVIRKI